MNSRVVIAVLAIVVLGGGSMGYLWWRSAGEAEDRKVALLRSVRDELDAVDLDRETAVRTLQKLVAALDQRPDAELTRAKAGLELALDRAGDAWATIGGIATSLEGSPLDRWVGARVLRRLHAETGDAGYASQAIGMARVYYESSFDAEAAFLAWQVAYRINEIEDWLSFGQRLRDDHADSLEAQTVAVIEHFLATHIAMRIGIDLANARDLAASESASEDRRALCQFMIETATAATMAPEELFAQMLELERQWDERPPELAVLLARYEIFKGEAKKDQDPIYVAVDILRDVLREFPVFVEARHLIQLAFYGLNQVTEQKAHLRWLIENCDRTDVRRDDWQRQFK